jgi:hypothetical protein
MKVLYRMPSSGILRRVAIVRTDVSEESSASIIRVARLGELGTMLAVTRNRRTQPNIPEDGILHSHRRENLVSIQPSGFLAGPCINFSNLRRPDIRRLHECLQFVFLYRC